MTGEIPFYYLIVWSPLYPIVQKKYPFFQNPPLFPGCLRAEKICLFRERGETVIMYNCFTAPTAADARTEGIFWRRHPFAACRTRAKESAEFALCGAFA
jgi:hypothetical protein